MIDTKYMTFMPLVSKANKRVSDEKAAAQARDGSHQVKYSRF
jgi:hypothetical protein